MSDPDTSRTPPCSAEAEEHVIACCLIDDGASLARARERLTPDSFYFPANRLIFEVLPALPTPSLDLLVAELQSRRQLDAIGGLPYLIQITSKIPTTAHAGFFIQKVREKASLRQAIRAATQTVEDAYNFTGGLDEFLQKANARLSAITVREPAKDFADLLRHRVRASAPPPEPATRLFLANKPICTAGNITTLTSKAKTGKTAALGAATAAIISASSGTSTLTDTFKFRATNPDGHAVIVFDTEQSPYDAYQCYQRSLKRAGQETDPAWLHHYSLVGLSARLLHQALLDAVTLATRDHKGIFAIILDGVADFVNSVNDEAESNQFVTWLRELTVTHNCPAICVIHSNEGDKAGLDSRGHLGKQLIRKAESNLLLKKTGEITTITSDKQRKAPITEADQVAFQWSETEQRHVSCESASTPKSPAGRKRLHTIQEFWDVIPAKGTTAKAASQIHRMANDLKEIKLQTFKDLLADATKDGLLLRTYDEKTGFGYTKSL